LTKNNLKKDEQKQKMKKILHEVKP